MSIEASFDTLFIVERAHNTIGSIHKQEIHSLCYLAQLLSLYDGNAINEWGYHFTYEEGVFSPEIEKEINECVNRRYISNVKGNDVFEITSSGVYFIESIDSLKRFSYRKKYLIACIDAALSIPLPIVINSISNEPMTKIKRMNNNRELLGTGLSLDMLYEHFSAIKTTLGKNIHDIWIAALVWLNYLNDSTMEV